MNRTERSWLVMAALLISACSGRGQRVSSAVPVVSPDTRLTEAAPSVPATPALATPIADAYRDTARQIQAAAQADRAGFEKLRHLTDQIGHRLSGTPAFDAAVAWAHEAMRADGHEVRLEKVMVPRWVRGTASARITAPIQRDLVVLALGGTIGTPKGGVTGPIVVVRSWEELEAKQAAVKDAIVLVDVAMPTWSEEHGSGYGKVAEFRWGGARKAARFGARAVLMRSVTAHSLRSPHTGSMSYDPAVTKIPAAAVTTEDADLLVRLTSTGTVSVRLDLSSKQLPDVPSANVIGELRGRERPDEVVLIGAHLDSWDVGQGAHDDGAGCIHVMQALTVLRRLGLTPRRTIRVVLFANEENGLRGADAYAEAHHAEAVRHVAAIESDMGGFAPRGFELHVVDEAARSGVRARLLDIASLLVPLNAMAIEDSDHAGSDVEAMVELGVAGLGFSTDNRTYFDIHHTAADTLDKVDPAVLADGVATMAIMAYVLADMPEPLHTPVLPPADTVSGS